jgi:hypothetical protein
LAPFFTSIVLLQCLSVSPSLAGEVGVKIIGVEVVCSPIKVGDFVNRTKRLLRVSVAVQAKAHTQRLSVVNDRHLINATVAFFAAHSAVHVGRVIKVGVVGSLVDLDPLNWFPRVTFVIFIHSHPQRF